MKKINPSDVFNAFIAAFITLFITLFLASLVSGCVYKGAKVTEGTDLAVGLNVPVSEGTLQLQVLNYLSGFRLGVDRNAILRCRYTVCETNDYLGCIHTRVTKTADTEVIPLETNATVSVKANVEPIEVEK